MDCDRYDFGEDLFPRRAPSQLSEGPRSYFDDNSLFIMGLTESARFVWNALRSARLEMREILDWRKTYSQL